MGKKKREKEIYTSTYFPDDFSWTRQNTHFKQYTRFFCSFFFFFCCMKINFTSHERPKLLQICSKWKIFRFFFCCDRLWFRHFITFRSCKFLVFFSFVWKMCVGHLESTKLTYRSSRMEFETRKRNAQVNFGAWVISRKKNNNFQLMCVSD